MWRVPYTSSFRDRGTYEFGGLEGLEAEPITNRSPNAEPLQAAVVSA